MIVALVCIVAAVVAELGSLEAPVNETIDSSPVTNKQLCEARATTIPRSKWFQNLTAVVESITAGSVAEPCYPVAYTVSNDSDSISNIIRNLNKTSAVVITFPSAVEGGTFSTEQLVEQVFYSLLYYGSQIHNIAPITITFDLVYPDAKFISKLLNNLSRLLGHYRFTTSGELKIRYRLVTRVSPLVAHLLAESADEITLVHDGTPAGIDNSLRGFLAEDCVLCLEFLFPKFQYKFKLSIEKRNRSDCLLIDCATDSNL